MNLNFPPLISFALLFLSVFLIFLIIGLKKSRAKYIQKLDQTAQASSVLKRRISELEGEQVKVSAILKSMAEGVIAVDGAKRILLVNPAAESIFDIQGSRFLNRGLIEMARNQSLERMMDEAIEKQTVVSGEIEIHHPSNKILMANAVGVPKDEGTVSGILVLYDITEIRKLERLRQEFVANVSHELKTPLTSIKGFIETLLAGALKDHERAEAFLKMMEEDTERLNRLIGDLLELSKLESKEAALKIRPVDLTGELKKLIATFEPRFRENKISVVDQISGNSIPKVLADPDRLKQVLINLIDNAIKFNRPNGQIIFSAQPQNGKITVSIEDTGLGIPKESVPRVFERFFCVDKARARGLGGTGLGLSIVKHIIEVHGGDVWCESQVGKGSKFSFTLPYSGAK
jgi:two-component system phosphate regulon sensor histidine kinase PhoR